MTAPKSDDAGFRYTDSGQPAIHYLGTRLRNPVQNPVQTVFTHRPADVTGTTRYVTVGGVGYDLTAEIRQDGSRQSLADFLAAVRRGASVEYLPSLSSPSLSFPCEVVNAAEIQADRDFWFQRRDQTAIRLRRTDGGTWQALIEEPLFYWRAGNAPPGLVFTRSGAVGKYTDSDGVLKDAAADVWRTEWSFEGGGVHPDTPWLLLESPAFTNLVDSDDLTAWSTSGTPVVTGSVSDPAGDTGAHTVEDDSGAGGEFIHRTVTFTGDATTSLVFVVRENTMPATENQFIKLRDTTAGADRLTVSISAWSGGEPTYTVGTGTDLGKRYVGNGYWAIYALAEGVVVGNTNRVEISPSFYSSETGSIDVYRVNAYSDNKPPWSILDASETKNAETFYADFPHVPQAMCGLVDFRELEDPDFSDQRIIQFGSAGNSNPRLQLYRVSASDLYRLLHNNNSGSQVTSTVDLNPSWGDRIQLAWWLYADGSVNIWGRKQALGSSSWSAWTEGTQSGALSLAAAWSDERIYFGSVGSSGRGSQLFQRAVVFPGTSMTADELLAA